MQTIEFKKVLFLENEWWDEKHSLVGWIKKDFDEMGIECKVIDFAFKKPAEVIDGIMWAEAIFFQTTFLYGDQIHSIGNLFRKIPDSKMIFGIASKDGSLMYNIEKIFSVQELAALAHHRIFEVFHQLVSSKDGDWCKEYSMKVYTDKLDELEKERIERNKGYRKTGRKVLICEIGAVGKEWSLLKPGNVVDELDCTAIDPNPDRGTWVMGFSEPVKLLNSDRYEEWKYDDPTAMDLAIEFASRGNKKTSSSVEILAGWIYRSVSPLQTDVTELWDWCDNICKMFSMERRGNRHYFEERLKEYGNKFYYFRDGRGI